MGRFGTDMTGGTIPEAIASGAETIMLPSADVLVNCLGAWSPVFSAKIGVTDVTEPVRRQICLVDVHASDLAPGVSLENLGMIVDASDLYFHPEGPHLLAGYSIPEEAPGFDFAYDGEDFFVQEVWPRLAAVSATWRPSISSTRRAGATTSRSSRKVSPCCRATRGCRAS